MAQQTEATFSLKYGATAQRFTPSGSSAQFSAGVSAAGGFNFTANGGASVFSRVLLPLNSDFSTGSGIGNEGFKFSSFPEMEDSAGNPISDINGLPLDFSSLTLLCVHVRAIDPDLPWGGTVSVTTVNATPGGAFGQTGIDSESIFLMFRKDGWTPDDLGEILVEFFPTSAPVPTMVNALVELLVMGNPNTPIVPFFSAPPTISGTTIEGSDLTAASGTFGGVPTPLDGYQWVRCSVGGDVLEDITGATGGAYNLAPADVGYTIRVRQIASNTTGTASELSAKTAAITT